MAVMAAAVVAAAVMAEVVTVAATQVMAMLVMVVMVAMDHRTPLVVAEGVEATRGVVVLEATRRALRRAEA